MLSYKKETGLTGSLIEEEVLGEVASPEDFESWREHKGKTFQRFFQAVRMVKQCQPENHDPQDPPLALPSKLHNDITTALNISWENLRYFTCVHFGELDYRHGVDAIFEWTTDDHEKIVVSLDLTINPNKASPHADVVFVWPAEGLDPSLPEDRQAWDDKVQEVTQAVVAIFQRRAAKVKLSHNQERAA